ncbi:MAG TPA: 50S ribosomal protein L25 [Chthoniobacteraceae bacterium]|jgi:large subunit ribosomal protein L25|nr:50S ribosomal protein L25 [Chthoniobacteraceae bacterium]
MAKQVKLSAQARGHIGGSVGNKLKREGLIPAIIYGGKEPSLPVQVGARDISNLLSHALGENILVELEIDNAGEKSSRMALIQEVQHAPLSGSIVHVDFHAINMNETLHTSVPVEPRGEPAGVKSYGGILEQSLRSLEIACLPKDLPEVLTVDVSGLNIGDSIHVRHIQLPEGVKALDDADLTVFLVAAPAVAEVAAPAAAATAAQPEVIKEKKEEGGSSAPEKK